MSSCLRETVTGLTSACNEVCECTTKGFEPMCVEDVVYFSPCHAGCVTYRTDGDQKVLLKERLLRFVSGIESSVSFYFCLRHAFIEFTIRSGAFNNLNILG